MVPDAQELAKLHPLFSRLTGQVIWQLFEEYDAAARADAFMDRYLAWREGCLRILRPVLLGEPDMPPYIQVLVDGAAWGAGGLGGEARICPSCVALHQVVIPTAHPNAVRFLPPYSLGCRSRPVALSLQDFAGMKNPCLADLEGDPPGRKLSCDEDWLFDVDWA